jgi:hypothetical protein
VAPALPNFHPVQLIESMEGWPERIAGTQAWVFASGMAVFTNEQQL